MIHRVWNSMRSGQLMPWSIEYQCGNVTHIPHGGPDFGEFFIGKTTHSAFPGAEASAGAPP